MAFTLQEIEDNIKKYTELKKKVEEKISNLIENFELKRMQNGNDSVEVQDIGNTINALILLKREYEDEISRFEELKLSRCEKKSLRSKLTSDFYGY